MRARARARSGALSTGTKRAKRARVKTKDYSLIRLTRPRSAVPLFSSKLSKPGRFAAVARGPNSRGLTASGGPSPLLHSPLEPALLTQFTGVGLSLAISGPIPRSVNCAHVPSNVYKFFPQLSPGLTFLRDCQCASLRHLRVPVKIGWPRPGPPSGRGGKIIYPLPSSGPKHKSHEIHVHITFIVNIFMLFHFILFYPFHLSVCAYSMHRLKEKQGS